MQIRALVNQAVVLLREQGFESARLEAELLMMHVTKFNKVQLLTHDLEELPALDETVYKALVDQRMQGTPIAYILGERDFWDLTLKVTPDTLIPRPDTEILVEKALTLIQCNHCRDVLDLGTGTGAIILALKHSAPEIRATAVDLSPNALAVAMENAQRYHLDVDFRCGSWFTPLLPERESAKGFKPQFDLIVSNPPYIEEYDPHLQEGDVRFEPLSALVSGHDGLKDIRLIVHESRAFLRPNGYLMFEHGYNQGAAVRQLLEEVGFAQVETLRDYGQNERVTLGRALS